jgi:hypothetical protein
MKNELTESVRKTFDKAHKICVIKNEDYASTDSPFKNFEAANLVGLSAEQALLLQMANKLSRIGNLIGDKKAKNEPIEDSLIDLINYAAILKAYIEHKK